MDQKNLQTVMEFVKNRQGGDHLLHDGYRYKKSLQRGEKVYWVCSKKDTENCKGRCKSQNGVVQVTNNNHNHSVDSLEGYKKKTKFSVADDLLLLRETLSNNPYENTKKWKIIHDNVLKISQKDYTLKCVKDHVEYLINLYTKIDKTNLKTSEIREQNEEKKQILKDLKILRDEYKTKQPKKDDDQQEEMQPVKAELLEQINETEKPEEYFTSEDIQPQTNELEESQILEMELIQQHDHLYQTRSSSSPSLSETDTQQSSRKRKIEKSSIAELLIEKRKQEIELEHRKLNVEERKIDIETKKLELEKLKVQQLINLQQQQQQLFAMLVQKFGDQ